MQTRRELLCDALKLSAGLALGSELMRGESAEPVAVLSVGSQPWTKLPSDFMGLGLRDVLGGADGAAER